MCRPERLWRVETDRVTNQRINTRLQIIKGDWRRAVTDRFAKGFSHNPDQRFAGHGVAGFDFQEQFTVLSSVA